jgi:hypothetical protein
MYKIIFSALLGFVLFSCSDSLIEAEDPANNSGLEAFWINGEFADTTYTYQRADSLSGDQYCFGFEANGVFVENKNAGWCGTPPIYYNRFEGEWSMEDSIIYISVPYWGGMSQYTWKLLEINEDRFTYAVIETEYQHAEE